MLKNGRFVSYPSLENLTSATMMPSLLNFLHQYPIGNALFRTPLSHIKDERVAMCLEAVLNAHLPSHIPVFRKKSMLLNRVRIKSPILLPNNVIIIPKTLRTSAEAQILRGKLWYLSQSPWVIIVYLYDPAGFFQKISMSIPSQIHSIFHPKPHQSKKIYPDPNRSINQGGFSIYDGHHPALKVLNAYCDQTYTTCNIPAIDASLKDSEILHPFITPSNITKLLTMFPLEKLCTDSAFANPILVCDERWSEVHFEWILTYFLRLRFIKWAVNQFRTDRHIFDLNLDDRIIIEFKYLKTRTEYFRLIGQLWEYSEYKKFLIAYVVLANKNLHIDPKYLPENCSLIEKIILTPK